MLRLEDASASTVLHCDVCYYSRYFSVQNLRGGSVILRGVGLDVILKTTFINEDGATKMRIIEPSWSQLIKVIAECDVALWDLYNSRDGQTSLTLTKERRLSEQEARFVMAILLDRHGIPFTPESPTFKKYAFSGISSRSAMIDLEVWPKSNHPINVEFKAKPCSSEAHTKTKERVRKDLEKLIREKDNGVWFHILMNDAALPALLRNLGELLVKVGTVHKQSIANNSILFHINLINQKYSIQRTIKLADFLEDIKLQREFADSSTWERC